MAASRDTTGCAASGCRSAQDINRRKDIVTVERIVHRCLIPAVLLALSACVPAAPPPAPEPEPVVEVPEPEPEPAAEADFSVAERLRAPFAVRTVGQTAPRMPRTVIVAEPVAPAAPAASADTVRAARPAPESASPPPAAAAPAPPAPSAPPARPSAAPPARAERAPTAHQVAAGETFLAIARRYGVTYSQLQAANPGVEPDRLRPGQSLRLPANVSAARPAPPPPAQMRRVHVVEQGETLWSIARRYGVEMERIRAANQLQGDQVRLGQRLVIPDPE
jgi:LysM repeat protein